MKEKTKETIADAKKNMETILDIIYEVERGASYAAACAKHGVQYMKFKHYIEKMFYFDKTTSKPMLAVSEFDPTPAERLYAKVFSVDVRRVNEMMPDDAEEAIEKVMETLLPREVDVLRTRMSGETLESVASYFNLTRERIRQIEAKAFRKLRHPSRSRLLMLGEDVINREQTEFEQEKDKLLAQYRESLRLKDEEYQKAKRELEPTESTTALDKITIEEMGLTVRSFNCCKQSGIGTVADLMRYSEKDLLKIRNLGLKSLKEIKTILATYGLTIEEEHKPQKKGEKA